MRRFSLLFSLWFTALLVPPASAFLCPSHARPIPAAVPARTRLRLAEHSADGSGGMETVLFVEVGFGADQHGQDPTKACVRACRNAIEFNSIPSIKKIVPGGYEGMKLRVQLAVPCPEEEVDMEAVKAVFPYGNMLPVEFQRGGMRASSGIALPEMGDANDDMIIAVACVTVGY